MTVADYMGSLGVSMLLLAFILALINKISKVGKIYLLMNVFGSALAAIASYLIRYTPFIILETAWMIASLFGLWQAYTKKSLQH
jgi:TRAP-type mannitol/chloroaromatic compound transport system permease small subunit